MSKDHPTRGKVFDHSRLSAFAFLLLPHSRKNDPAAAGINIGDCLGKDNNGPAINEGWEVTN